MKITLIATITLILAVLLWAGQGVEGYVRKNTGEEVGDAWVVLAYSGEGGPWVDSVQSSTGPDTGFYKISTPHTGNHGIYAYKEIGDTFWQSDSNIVYVYQTVYAWAILDMDPYIDK